MHAPDPASGVADPRRFLPRRLHSLCGVLPVGVFLVLQPFTSLRTGGGRGAMLRAVGAIQSTPALAVIEVALVLAPLAFHALYGIALALRARGGVARSGDVRSWLFALQRASGVAALAFVLVHLGLLRVARLLGAARWETLYERLALTLGSTGMFVLYALGVTASVFHVTNGLWTSAQTWGLASTERARRRAAVVCAALGVALWLVGYDTVLHFFYRCGGVLPWPGLDRDALCRDADMLRAMVDAIGAHRYLPGVGA